MQEVLEQSARKVGFFDFEVCGSGRDGRQRSSKFRVRCDAIGLYTNEILLLSVAGAETSVKALTAGLRSSGKTQKRIDYAAHVGGITTNLLTRCLEGYHMHRTKLGYGLWHVLCLAKREGFMPVMTEEALCHILQGEQFTTPLLRDWMPWLYQKMKIHDVIIPLTQSGCQAGLLLADNDALDKLVTEGIRKRHLQIAGEYGDRSGSIKTDDIETLDDYMLAHGSLLGKQAERSLDPWHVPGRDPSQAGSGT
jgi:hypothetical protein